MFHFTWDEAWYDLLSPLFQGLTGSTCEYDAQACGGLHCRNGGTCVSGQKSPRCFCPVGFMGPECQHLSNGPCTSNPCYNGGTCEPSTESPYFHCVCPADFNGLFCHILDYSFKGGFGREITPPEVEASCEVAECDAKKGNKECDAACNTYACDWDGGDCSLNFRDPWQNCSAALQCWRYFNNGKCDEQCHNPGCLYDGFDCQRSGGECKWVDCLRIVVRNEKRVPWSSMKSEKWMLQVDVLDPD